MTLRIYYNRGADAPLVWSFDLGTQETEITIRDWKVAGCDVVAGMDSSVASGDKERPKVWMSVLLVEKYDVRDDVLYVDGVRS
jgi:hypothetical protein